VPKQTAADEYREIAGRFTELVEGVPDDATWERQSPVKEWTARDVVRHLVEWFPGFLEGGTGITLNRTYYVIAGGLTATKFAFSATPGGAAVDVTVDATAAAFHKISLSDYGPQAKISAAGYTAADNEPTGALLANRSRIAGGG